MKKLLISVLVFLLIASTNAHAVQQSTVNPLIPVQNAPLQSAPIRNNFLATYNDINNIYGLISANGSTSVYLGSPFSANPSIQNDPASGFFTAGTQRVDVNIAGTQIFEWNSSGATLNSGLLTLVNPLSGASGGTGVNNTGKTITLGGNLATSGAFNSTFTMTGATNVTFPTSGTLLTSGATTGIYLGTSVTATNPQISTDATTGLYTAGAAEVDVSISGTKRLSVTSTITTTFGSLSVNGNFGVGAGSVMTVNGTTGNTGVSGTLQVTGHVTFEGVTSTGAIGTGNLVFSISPTFTGTTTAAALNLSGAEAITSTSANALSVGANGTTNPALNVDNSTASSATGVSIKSAAAAAGASILVTSSGTNEFLNLTAKGNSFIRPRNSSGSTTGPSTTPVMIVQNTDATVNNLVPIAFRNSNGNTLSQIESVASSQSAGTGVLNIYGFGAGTGTLGLSVGSTGAVEAPVTLAVGTSSIAGTGTVLDLGNAANASLALGLPVGTTGQRPAGANGMLRYNSTGSGAVESYINGAWTALSTGNQTITLTGVVTGSGTTAITTSFGSFSSATLAAALTDETGSGSAVFGTSPTIASPTFTGTVAGANTVPLTILAQAAANTVVGNWTGSTANEAANAMPSCSDTGGNHLNYVSGTGITCGTSSAAPVTKLKQQVITSTGTFTSDTTSNNPLYKFTIIGAGGGSGGCAVKTTGQTGSGGGAGGSTAIYYTNLTSNTAYNVTVGAGGTAGVAGGADGGQGGSSTVVVGVTTVTGTGGRGSATQTSDQAGTGALAVAATNGTYNITGSDGWDAVAGQGAPSASVSGSSGHGGASQLSGSTKGGGFGSSGNAGYNYGGGAGGCINVSGSVTENGAVGGAGIVIVEWVN